MTFRGTIQNGRVILADPTALPNGTRVDITPSRKRAAARKSRPTGPGRAAKRRSTPRTRSRRATVFDTLKPFIGALKHLPKDAAANINHYLYGATKQR